MTGMNIIGGPYLGGNFWANPGDIGFSQNCADGNRDGICDSAYALDSNNTDYLPLAYRAEVISRYAGSDGIVQKSEAVKAVMDYFDGIITKQDAINVVLDYFAG